MSALPERRSATGGPAKSSEHHPDELELHRRKGRVLSALSRDVELTALDQRVITCLLVSFLCTQSGWRFGLMWPSAELLAKRVGAQTRSVRRSLRRLLAREYLVVAIAGGGSGRATFYAIGPIGNSDRRRPETVTGGALNSDRRRRKQ
jgi:hypothetical protein